MRLIDADAVLKNLDDLKKSPWYHFDNPFVRQGMRECMEVVEEACIKDAPTVEAEPVRHGHWIEHPFSAVFEKVHSKDQIVCSCCEEAFNAFFNETERFKYCPNCGAKMDEVEE